MTFQRFHRFAFLTLALALGGAFWAAEAHADAKIGYIDSSRILSEYKGVEDAKRAFDLEVKNWEKEEERMRGEIDSLTNEFKSQNMMLTETTRKEKENSIKSKRGAYEEFVKSIWGQEGKIVQKNSELMKPIIDKVNVILEKIGNEENYTMIFDAASGGVVFASPQADLTARVVGELNKGTQ